MACFEESGSNTSVATDETVGDEDVGESANRILQNFIDDLILGVAFLVHYESKAEKSVVEEKQGDNVDVLGQPLNKLPDVKCECPECGYKIAASRFAPHLAKCLGKGRASFRVASQKIADENSSDNVTDIVETIEQDEYLKVNEEDSDEEWLPKKGEAKKRKTKSDARNVYVGTKKDAKLAYEGMTYANRKMLLQKICGVVSNQTGRYCMRSMKCPHHSSEERSAVRNCVLDYLGQQAGTSKMDITDTSTFAEELL